MWINFIKDMDEHVWQSYSFVEKGTIYATHNCNCCPQICQKMKGIAEATTHMLHIPTVVCQLHGQGQPEMDGNYFSEENRISSVQASQIPVKTI